jgi:DNA invertase Pin-like site-specific DNA recombinase
MRIMTAAIYVRVSTLDQNPGNQLHELRAYTAARGWRCHEYIDHGVSGSKDRRPALDQLIEMPNAGALTCWCAGDWIHSDATCGT